jgi:hypothetical protein
MSHRWDDYVISIEGGGCSTTELWNAAETAIGESKSMYVLAVGFDPRALIGLRVFLAQHHPSPPIVCVIELPPNSAAPNTAVQGLVHQNLIDFDRITAGVEVRRIIHQEVHAASSAGPRVSQELTKLETLEGVGHLIIDISSLPVGLYFPMIAAVIQSFDRGLDGMPEQFQVVACENPQIDAAISNLGVAEASFVGGFQEPLLSTDGRTTTVIWAPVLGENSAPSLDVIHNFLSPADICPILPFPAIDPRRADNLLLELKTTLLDGFRVTPGDLIYADERNPFDLYRTLCRLQSQTEMALSSLGSATVALSTHSSKVLSLGALLAAVELELPVIQSPSTDYEIDLDALPADPDQSELICAWLTGVPYV